MKLADYNKLQVRAGQLRTELNKVEKQIDEFRLETLRKVEMQRNDRSITLIYNGRKLNVTKNAFGYTQVKEKGKFIAKDLFGNVHDVRFAVAMGQI
jgi:hypothetical protein